jgi:hypothetical protein
MTKIIFHEINIIFYHFGGLEGDSLEEYLNCLSKQFSQSKSSHIFYNIGKFYFLF